MFKSLPNKRPTLLLSSNTKGFALLAFATALYLSLNISFSEKYFFNALSSLLSLLKFLAHSSNAGNIAHVLSATEQYSSSLCNKIFGKTAIISFIIEDCIYVPPVRSVL